MKNNRAPMRLSPTEFTVLDHLRSGRAMYGLELVKESKGLLKRGTIYVLLNRMIEKGYVEDQLEHSERQKELPRRLYTITGLGQKHFAAEIAAQNILGSAIV